MNTIDDELENNCFTCHDSSKCATYQPYQNTEECVYKIVAQHDLLKHLQGNKYITLGIMLNEYLELSKR